jgi:hypothetical protein
MHPRHCGNCCCQLGGHLDVDVSAPMRALDPDPAVPNVLRAEANNLAAARRRL